MYKVYNNNNNNDHHRPIRHCLPNLEYVKLVGLKGFRVMVDVMTAFISQQAIKLGETNKEQRNGDGKSVGKTSGERNFS